MLARGTGICYAMSHPLAVPVRDAGFPTGLCSQVYRYVPPDAGVAATALHGFNTMYLASLDRRIRIDA